MLNEVRFAWMAIGWIEKGQGTKWSSYIRQDLFAPIHAMKVFLLLNSFLNFFLLFLKKPKGGEREKEEEVFADFAAATAT